MKKKYLKAFLTGIIMTPFFGGAQTDPGIEIGDNFIVFEAEAVGFPSGSWKLLTPTDADYQMYVTSSSASGIAPVNDTYLEYKGPWQDPSEASKIEFTFVAPKTGDYQLAGRLHQPLEAGEAGDAANDFFVKMTGNFESATAALSTSQLKSKQKFWGRGVNLWGTSQFLIHSYLPTYKLIGGEQYTLTLFGRSPKACLDYIILFDTELRLNVSGDLASNPALYRPGGWDALNDKVAKIVFNSSKTGIEQIGDSQTLTYKVFPSTAVDKSITWTSNNESVATVDANGVVTGVSEGKATITATSNDGGAVATNEVNVGKYIVTFDDYTTSNFDMNTYVGDNGNEWQMRAKSTTRFGNTNAIQINRGLTGVKGTDIKGGISSFTIRVKHLFQPDLPHITQLLINDNEVGSITRTQTGAYDFTVENINVAGDFSLELKNASDGTKTFATLYDDLSWTPFQATASIEDKLKKTLSLSPNPVSEGLLSISGLYSTQNVQINIFDISGRALNLNNSIKDYGEQLDVDVSHLKNGIYLIVINEESQKIYSNKFIVKN